MEDLFRVAFTNLMKDLKYQLERSYARKKDLRIASAIRPDLLTHRLLHALATGNWVGGRAGVSQLLDRTSNMSTDISPEACNILAYQVPASLRGS